MFLCFPSCRSPLPDASPADSQQPKFALGSIAGLHRLFLAPVQSGGSLPRTHPRSPSIRIAACAAGKRASTAQAVTGQLTERPALAQGFRAASSIADASSPTGPSEERGTVQALRRHSFAGKPRSLRPRGSREQYLGLQASFAWGKRRDEVNILRRPARRRALHHSLARGTTCLQPLRLHPSLSRSGSRSTTWADCRYRCMAFFCFFTPALERSAELEKGGPPHTPHSVSDDVPTTRTMGADLWIASSNAHTHSFYAETIETTTTILLPFAAIPRRTRFPRVPSRRPPPRLQAIAFAACLLGSGLFFRPTSLEIGFFRLTPPSQAAAAASTRNFMRELPS
ncbi:uncharacterized protein BDZ99DRAFT_479801 [Mytilinidion resinicola]|uniref:Uncharacterized protein n=1 Tax=Mytilinidion resinicola TaxID=574789 RepID=A0A6A6YET6_9PEZI|nr:uncharacterized protein BDZ99DRAFT_479801 [Mytilinidion resinicola]KAF2806565.1 hypothetical protein BDZ99DRAFT_479801 [Mytilinidion resinicola]